MLNHCLEWYKWVLTSVNTGSGLTHLLFRRRTRPQLWLLRLDCISRLSGPVRLMNTFIRHKAVKTRYTTPDIHYRDRRYVWDGGIKHGNRHLQCFLLNLPFAVWLHKIIEKILLHTYHEELRPTTEQINANISDVSESLVKLRQTQVVLCDTWN